VKHRLTMKHRVLRWLGVVSPSGAYPPPVHGWARDVAAGPAGPSCLLACCSLRLADEDDVTYITTNGRVVGGDPC